MSLQFGSPIGAVQYNGLTIGEAMFNGEVVWRSESPMSATVTKQTTDASTVRMARFTIPETGVYVLDLSIAAGFLASINVNGTSVSNVLLGSNSSTQKRTALVAGDVIEVVAMTTTPPATLTVSYGVVLAPIKSFYYDFEFQDIVNVWWAPLSSFDQRTHASSQRRTAWAYNNMLVMGDNSQPSYEGRLLNREIDQEGCEWTVTFGDVMNTRARPMSIIVASTINQSDKIVIDFGSDGAEAYRLNGTTKTSLGTRNRTLSSGHVVTVIRDADQITLYHNGALWAYFDVTSVVGNFRGVPGKNYMGFGMYSTNGQWSSRVGRIQITGSTTFDEVPKARTDLWRIQVPRGTWTRVGEIHYNVKHLNAVISLLGAKWPQASSNGDRMFRVLMGNTVIGTTPDEGGTLTTIEDIPANTWLFVEAYADTSNSGYRTVTDGYLSVDYS